MDATVSPTTVDVQCALRPSTCALVPVSRRLKIWHASRCRVHARSPSPLPLPIFRRTGHFLFHNFRGRLHLPIQHHRSLRSGLHRPYHPTIHRARLPVSDADIQHVVVHVARAVLDHGNLSICPFELGPRCLRDTQWFNITNTTHKILVDLMNSSKGWATHHSGRLKVGFRRTVVDGALDAPGSVDVKAFTWMLNLPAFADKARFQDFVTSVPDSMVLLLMKIKDKDGRSTFYDQLCALFQTCLPGGIELEKSLLQRRLAVCLNAVYQAVKELNTGDAADPRNPLLEDIRVRFASTTFMSDLRESDDVAVRVSARCIWALIAQQVLTRQPRNVSELA
ncbi:hypothetical protein BC834DRAFT_144033 [Gloeopeniophorella convolvens]|nr:hypothetical protein BC834DRAFT_144033 [Gloeopeniophorella convolvens]